MKTAIVGDFIFEGGSEQVVDTIAGEHPQADIYITIIDTEKLHLYPNLQKAWDEGRIKTGFSQELVSGFLSPLRKELGYYAFFWLFFIDVFFQKVHDYDLAIISSCGHAKGYSFKNLQNIVIYCHAPTRYLYKEMMLPEDYNAYSFIQKCAVTITKPLLQWIDQRGARALNAMNATWIGNSTFIASMIKKYYHAEAKVIYPPVEVEDTKKPKRAPQDYYLYHGRIVVQKRVDIAISACLKAKKKLVISGKWVTEELKQQLDSIIEEHVSKHPEDANLIEFRGRTTNEELAELFKGCKALLFPPREDFGMTPIEALSAGVPIIAYGDGGALDYVIDGVNGVLFTPQTVDGMIAGITAFESKTFKLSDITSSAQSFGKDRFINELSLLTHN